jgi:hypothetical protein
VSGDWTQASVATAIFQGLGAWLGSVGVTTLGKSAQRARDEAWNEASGGFIAPVQSRSGRGGNES